MTSFSIPGLVPPKDPDYHMLDLAEATARREADGKQPNAQAVRQRYEGFMEGSRAMWRTNVLFFLASLCAAAVTFWRRQLGVWLVLIVCAYLLYVSGPPFVRMAMNGGFLNFVSLVFSASLKHHGTGIGLVLFWHIVVAPFAYLILALTATSLIWQTRKGARRESNL